MKKVFWTTIFWLVIIVLFGFYVKSYNQDLGSKIIAWLTNTGIVNSLTNDESSSVLSGVNGIQTTLETMNSKLDDITAKLGATTSNTYNISTNSETKGSTGTGTK